MTDINNLNIGFLDLVQDKNWIDNFVLGLAGIDDSPSTLSLSEIEEAFKEGSERLASLNNCYLNPQTLFKDLRSYLTLRWVRHFYKLQEETEGGDELSTTAPVQLQSGILWTHLALTEMTGMRDIGELVSAVVYEHPEIAIGDIISRSLFFAKEGDLVEKALSLSRKLCPFELMRLIACFERYKKGYKKDIAITLVELFEKRGVKDKSITGVLLEILEATEKPLLKEIVLDILKKRKQVMGALDLDFESLYNAFDREEGDIKRFKFAPLTRTFGAYIARGLGTLGIAGDEEVARMLKILDSKGYDKDTRAMIAYALGVIEYKTAGAKLKAAEGLYSFLDKIQIETDKDGLVFRYVHESIVSLAKLGFVKICGKDVIDILTRYAADMRHSDVRLTGVRSLGILGSLPETSDEDRAKILKVLSDALGDQGESEDAQPVRNAAYIWYDKVQKQLLSH